MFILGFIFSSIMGTIGHFIYKWTHLKTFKYLFASDEGLWSHLKLGITPIFIWSIIERFFLLDIDKIIPINGIEIFIYVIIITLVYLFGLIIKKEIPILNISSFYISLFIAYLTAFLLYNTISLPVFLNVFGSTVYLLAILPYFILSISY